MSRVPPILLTLEIRSLGRLPEHHIASDDEVLCDETRLSEQIARLGRTRVTRMLRDEFMSWLGDLEVDARVARIRLPRPRGEKKVLR